MAYIDRIKTTPLALRGVVQRGYPLAAWNLGISTSMYKRQSGEKVVDYKEKIRRGQDASSAYKMDATEVVTIEEGKCSFLRKSKPGLNLPDSIDLFVGLPATVDAALHLTDRMDEARSRALTKIYKKIQSRQQELSLPASLVEVLDVVRQFGAPMNALVDLTNRRLNQLALERKRLKGSTSFKRIKWHEIAANTWLEYSFGLAPIIADTRSIAEAIGRWQYEMENNKTPPFLSLPRIRARASVESGIQTVTTGNTVGYIDLNHNTFRKVKTEFGCNYVVALMPSYHADFGSNDRLLQLLGFDHANWVPALWEGVPWSWLVDYFLNIQAILEAGATSTVDVQWVNHTERKVTTTTVVNSPDWGRTAANVNLTSYNFVSGIGTMARWEAKRTNLQRFKDLNKLGVPSLYVKHPFGNFKKTLNLVAALMSRRPNASAVWIS